MDDSLAQLREAVSAFGDRMGDAHLLPLAIALVLHLLSLLVRAGVWRGILAAAFPDRRVTMRSATLSYLAGVGANVVAPLRGGDVVRIFTIRRELGDASVTTIVSTLIAETAFGAVMIGALVVATAALGWLPPIVHLPNSTAFEFSFYARHTGLAAVASLIALVAAALCAKWAMHHVVGFWRRVVQGLWILRTPWQFVRVVAVPQLVDWILRIGVAYALLAAFGIPAAIRYAVLAVVIDSVSTALPFTPGGVGAQQGLLVFGLAGVAGSGQVMAYSVGAQVVIVGFNLLLGLIAVFLLFGHVRLGAVRRTAHAPA
jgi:uncharacterized membrane protein YbhN (UPF0104 family)